MILSCHRPRRRTIQYSPARSYRRRFPIMAALVDTRCFVFAEHDSEERRDQNAPRNFHDAGASAAPLVHRYARRGRGESAPRRQARLRRDVAWRAFYSDDRADPFAAHVHGGPRAAHQKPEIRHRRNLPAEPRSGDRRCRGGAVRSYEPRPLHARHRSRRPVVRFRAVRQRRPRRARAQDHGSHRDHEAHLGAGSAL